MERRAILVRGTVQGVGFRPFVYSLASQLQLRGFVQNDTGDVRIEVEGDPADLDHFVVELTAHPPRLARIECVLCEPCPPLGDHDFRIKRSVTDAAGSVAISPDTATCDDCLRELFDPQDRRYRYPFLNCTNCGPRLTIIRGVPYDRERTTMSGFPMCPACRAEYEDPLNRRFHAQPTACPTCGPRLSAIDATGQPITTTDPLSCFTSSILSGQLGAMKGLGGYHLICDASNPSAVADLRRRKHRDEKPFAIIVPDLAAAESLCHITPDEGDLLTSTRRPIVLLRKRPGTSIVSAVAPDNPLLGVMLPYTPLHHLLLHEMNGTPLVMTSGNRSDEPIAFREPEVFERLNGIADVFLTHDRPIHVRCDDSVTRVCGNTESPIRRSRGYAPQSIRLPIDCTTPTLAVGGQLKGTFALGHVNRAILSHHMGDLDHFEAFRAFEADVALYERLLAIRPRYIVHDLHPDYASTRYALNRSAQEGLPTVAVQHHHAHIASCMAEHGLTTPVIGVSFDGTGFGTDGAIWGGEFLVADLSTFRRAAHLRYVPMPGAEKAIREPWRMAVAHLLDAGVDCPPFRQRLGPTELRTVERMIDRRLNSPLTSSVGRLFDAVASLAGLCDRVSYEGQAAMRLESLASEVMPDAVYSFELPETTQADSASIVIDTRHLIRDVVCDLVTHVETARIARRFHHSLAKLIVNTCARLRGETAISTVVLSGGVFMNSLLTTEAATHLQQSGFSVFQHCLVPPNDGGLCLGQLAVAASRAATTGLG